jgi:hypothetical protein
MGNYTKIEVNDIEQLYYKCTVLQVVMSEFLCR